MSETTPLAVARLLGAKTGSAPHTNEAVRPASGPDRLSAVSKGMGEPPKETASFSSACHGRKLTGGAMKYVRLDWRTLSARGLRNKLPTSSASSRKGDGLRTTPFVFPV
jgi:hypothetical protein